MKKKLKIIGDDVSLVKISSLPDRAFAIGMAKDKFDRMLKSIKKYGVEKAD